MMEITRCSFLIRFDRFPWERSQFEEQPDLAEAIGSLLLHPMRASLGVTYILGVNQQLTEIECDYTSRCVLTIVAIVSLPFALIGALFLQFSPSYQKALIHLILPSTRFRQLTTTWNAEHFDTVTHIFRNALRYLPTNEIFHYLSHLLAKESFGSHTTYRSEFIACAFMRAMEHYPNRLAELIPSFTPETIQLLSANSRSQEQLTNIVNIVLDDPLKRDKVIEACLYMLGRPTNNNSALEGIFQNCLKYIVSKVGEQDILSRISTSNKTQLQKLQQLTNCVNIQIAAKNALDKLEPRPAPPPPSNVPSIAPTLQIPENLRTPENLQIAPFLALMAIQMAEQRFQKEQSREASQTY